MNVTAARQNNNEAIKIGDMAANALKTLQQGYRINKASYRAIKKPKWARFKAVITYADGNTGTLFSLDWHKEYLHDGLNPVTVTSPDDEQQGLKTLMDWIIKQYRLNNLLSFKIYCNHTEKKDSSLKNYNTEVWRWDIHKDGTKEKSKHIETLQFDATTKRVNLELLKTTPKWKQHE